MEQFNLPLPHKSVKLGLCCILPGCDRPLYGARSRSFCVHHMVMLTREERQSIWSRFLRISGQHAKGDARRATTI